MSLTKVTYSMIDGAVVNVLDYGADPTGSADSTTAIQNAINAAVQKTVYLPSGTYKISAPIQIKGSVVGDGLSTVIQPLTDDFAAFVNNSTSVAKFNLKGFYINYGVATGGSASSNSNSAGFYFTSSTNYPYEFSIEDIWISCAYYGYRDASSSYMFTLSNVRVDLSVNAFWLGTNGKTTVAINNCYANGFTGYGFYFFGINGLNFQSGGIDGGNNTVSGASLMTFATCWGVVLESVGYEVNITAYPFSATFSFQDVKGFSIDGLRGFNNRYDTGVDPIYAIQIANGSFGSISNATILGGDQGFSTGTGTVSTINISDTSRVTIDSSIIGPIPGSSGSLYSLTATGTSTTLITANNSAFVTNIVNANTKVINNQLNNISADLGNNNVYGITPGISNPIQYFNTPITGNLDCQFATVGLYTGATFRVIRTAAATGAFSINVAPSGGPTLKALSAGQWADFVYTGSAWACSAFGSL